MFVYYSNLYENQSVINDITRMQQRFMILWEPVKLTILSSVQSAKFTRTTEKHCFLLGEMYTYHHKCLLTF